MASFCKQCSEELWGEDSRDFVVIDAEHERLYTLCEDCGPTVVDRDGKCIGACTKKHGDVPVQTMQEFVDGKLPEVRKEPHVKKIVIVEPRPLEDGDVVIGSDVPPLKEPIRIKDIS